MTLKATYTSLRREIGRFIDAGRSSSDWDSTTSTDITDILDSGCRIFYYPTLNPNPLSAEESREVYRWSFLEEQVPVQLTSGNNLYELPETFSSIVQDFVYDDNSGRKPLTQVDERFIRSLIANESKTGYPTYCAVTTRSSEFSDGALHELLVYPTPTAAATITGGIEVEPLTLSTTNPYPLCGAIHTETLIAACLLAAEQKLRPESPPTQEAKFERLLRRSIEADRLLKQDGEELWPESVSDGQLDRLGVNKFYLSMLVGRFLKFPAHPKSWRHNQRAEVDEYVRTGLREFYAPQIIPIANSRPRVHSWSFLQPEYILTLEAGKSTYPMPEDFGSIRGDIRYAPNTGICYPKIEHTNMNQVRRMLQYSTDAGYAPMMAGIQPVPIEKGEGTRWELVLAPPPPGGEQIIIPYSVDPYDLAEDEALPLGGQPHAQTIIEACLAAAEASRPELGSIHTNKFAVRLQASISYDEQANCPKTVGFSLDRFNVNDGVYYNEDYLYDNHLTTYDNS
jgi:hypothetical protein